MSLRGKRVLITSGPTRGYIDAVRYISPRSTGALGSLIGIEALKRGAEVVFVYGKNSLTPEAHGLSKTELARLSQIEVDTVEDLVVILKSELSEKTYDVVIQSMAVLDYVPQETLKEKVPSGRDEWLIELVRTPKVIGMVKEIAPEVFLVGFKLEVGRSKDELVRKAHQSLTQYKADLFVANDLRQIQKGEHIGYIVDPQGEVVAEGKGKEKIAQELVRTIEARMASKNQRESL